MDDGYNARKPSFEEQSEAKVFKDQGNKYFQAKQYEQAIKMYDLAINKDPTESIYHSNKSRCEYNLEKYNQALHSAELALKIDEKNIKAHYLAAECLVKISEQTINKDILKQAIQKLKKSLTLCPSQGKGQFERVFIDKIYNVKKKLWLLNNKEQEQKKKAIRKYLIHLIETDQTLSEQAKDQLNDKVLKLVEQNSVKNRSRIQPALICPITKMMLKDPVCNQHGNSYSRQAYLREMQKNGSIDPLTLKPIVKKNILYSNINLKKAVEIFLEENPWAYDEVIMA